jgi:hypothetical protein
VRAVLALIGAVGLAACAPAPAEMPAPVVEVPRERVDAFVVLMEKLNCRFDPVDHAQVHTAGFTDDEVQAIGAVLVSEQRADLTDTGELVLLTEGCL